MHHGRSCLNLANKHRLENVAFPAISTGIYGYPKEEAAEVGWAGRAAGHAGAPAALSSLVPAFTPMPPPTVVQHPPPFPGRTPRPPHGSQVALKAVQEAVGAVRYIEFVLHPHPMFEAFVAAAARVGADEGGIPPHPMAEGGD